MVVLRRVCYGGCIFYWIKPVIIAFEPMNEKKSETSFAQIKSKIKVVVLGEQSTGKTSILMRFIHDKFEEGLGATIGIDFMAKNLHVGNNILRMQLWDTAGQQRFRSLIPSYLKDALIAFVVFDLTKTRRPSTTSTSGQTSATTIRKKRPY